jgi:hypothetical protein
MSFTTLYSIGVVGHRFLDLKQTLFVQSCCRALLSRFNQIHNVIALTALAEGTDTIFAEQALDLNLKLGAILPYQNYIDDFQSRDSRQRFFRLKKLATYEISHPYTARSDAAYQAAMDWIVDNSNLVVIAWNGTKYDGLRATENSAYRCVRHNRPWVHLDIQRLVMSFGNNGRQINRVSNTGYR